MPADDLPQDKQFASTLANGLELLQCFKPGEPLLGNREFVARTGLDKATVSRLCFTLTALGYLRHDIKLGKYRLGAAVLSMGYPLLASMILRQVARPLMNELASEVGGTVGIGIRDRAEMVYMDTARSEEGDAPLIDIGASMPLIATAIGRAWLTRADPIERESALNQIKVRYPKLFAEHARRLPQTMREMASRGYCTNPGYFQPDRLAVAVPMSRLVNSEIVVFNCTVPAARAATPDTQQRVGLRLVTLVRSVEVALGLR
ncbi:IclR family transcriptional regulator [Variovorax sp. dw_954]|uniref:IclR family transcriptional regulator n=1 Tax=Variovorax sp. dw_954 TaxID=2720078 RepID=UPI001BD2113E|nr:IclR family transcriptional regulator [Variovorax sp. dw_954]